MAKFTDPDYITFLGVLNRSIQSRGDLNSIWTQELETLVAAAMERFVVRDARGQMVRGEDGRISKHPDYYNELGKLIETIKNTERRNRINELKRDAMEAILHLQNQNVLLQISE